MDFGNVVIEHRPVIICQCKYNLCLICNGKLDSPEHDSESPTEDIPSSHSFYQRSKIFGPRVVIDIDTNRGKCHDCGREYKLEIYPITELVPY